MLTLDGCAHCLPVIPEELMGDAKEAVCSRCGYVTRMVQRLSEKENTVYIVEQPEKV